MRLLIHIFLLSGFIFSFWETNNLSTQNRDKHLTNKKTDTLAQRYFLNENIPEVLKSPFNGKELVTRDQQNTGIEPQTTFSFLTAGHLYGAAGNHFSIFPAKTFLRAIPQINELNPDFFMGLGDIIWTSGDSLNLKNIKEVTHDLKMPFYNAAGNHDLIVRENYVAAFGPTTYSFRYRNNLFLVIDSEILFEGGVKAQMDFITSVLETLFEPKEIGYKIHNLFIFSHKLIWAPSVPGFEAVDECSNALLSQSPLVDSLKMISDLIRNHTNSTPVYWFSGDVGTEWSFPLFFGKDPDYDLTYVACGLGDSFKDALVEVEVGRDGKVNLTAVSITGQPIRPLESYDIAFWEAYFNDAPPRKLNFINRFHNLITSMSFSYGLLAGAFGACLLILILSFIRAKKRRSA